MTTFCYYKNFRKINIERFKLPHLETVLFEETKSCPVVEVHIYAKGSQQKYVSGIQLFKT